MENIIRLVGFAHANGVTMLLAICVGLSAWDKALADPYPPAINLADIEEAGGVRLFGEPGGPSGFVNGIGDVNSDGIDDIIISDPYLDPGGRSYVLFGSPGGPASPVDLTNLDVTVGFRIDGAVSNGYSGGSVSSAGDFNADGISDVLIGAKTVSPVGGNLAGVTYVLYGVLEILASSLPYFFGDCFVMQPSSVQLLRPLGSSYHGGPLRLDFFGNKHSSLRCAQSIGL